MKRVLLAVLLCAAMTHRADAGIADFGWFADLAGSCWSGTFPDGITRHAHCYTTQFDRFMRGTARLHGEHAGQPDVDFAGDSVFAWDADAQRIVYYIWGSDGSHGRYEAHYEGDELVFPIESVRRPGTWAYRSVWRRIDDSTLEVRREIPEGDGWKAQLTVTYHRTAAVDDAE